MEPVARPISAAALPLDGAGRIDTDVPCRKCGYNLRGLLPESVCPECATAVGRSLHGDLLRFCDPTWVETLASGMNWIVGGIVVAVLLGCVGGGLLGIMGTTRPGVGAIPLAASKIIGALVVLVGYWKVTMPDPGRVGNEASLTARKLVRATQVIGLIAAPAPILLRSSIGALSAVLDLGILAVGAVGVLAIFVYARQLALRIPDDSLARQTRIVMWGAGIVAAVFVIPMVVGLGLLSSMAVSRATVLTTMPTSGPVGNVSVANVSVGPGGIQTVTTTSYAVGTSMSSRLRTITSVLALMSCGAGVGFMVFGIWSLRLIDKYRKALRESALIARRTWAAEAVAPPPVLG